MQPFYTQLDRDTSRKRCNTHFPQPFRSKALIDDKSGRVEVTRVNSTNDRPAVRNFVDDAKWTNVPVGDKWVASYNPYLLMRFDCHVHVYVVTATTWVKHLFKYVHNGEDYPKKRIHGIFGEIELYWKTRYIATAETTLRVLGFQMIDRNSAVTKIHAHLEEQ